MLCWVVVLFACAAASAMVVAVMNLLVASSHEIGFEKKSSGSSLPNVSMMTVQSDAAWDARLIGS